jgi:hypothetical protein
VINFCAVSQISMTGRTEKFAARNCAGLCIKTHHKPRLWGLCPLQTNQVGTARCAVRAGLRRNERGQTGVSYLRSVHLTLRPVTGTPQRGDPCQLKVCHLHNPGNCTFIMKQNDAAKFARQGWSSSACHFAPASDDKLKRDNLALSCFSGTLSHPGDEQ